MFQQCGQFSGKPGHIREFDSCQGSISELILEVWEMSGEKSCHGKLFILHLWRKQQCMVVQQSSALVAVPGPGVSDHVVPCFSLSTCLDNGVLAGCRIQPLVEASEISSCFRLPRPFLPLNLLVMTRFSSFAVAQYFGLSILLAQHRIIRPIWLNCYIHFYAVRRHDVVNPNSTWNLDREQCRRVSGKCLSVNNVEFFQSTIEQIVLPFHEEFLEGFFIAAFTLPSGWAGCYTCLVPRPYQRGPVCISDVIKVKSQVTRVRSTMRGRNLLLGLFLVTLSLIHI